jgi:arylsulfatase
VILILADDLGYSDLGCYGGEIETPNLDALAQNGLRFTQFYNTARCWPSRGALLSGYYAQQIHRDALPGEARGGQGTRPPWARLLPEWLRAAGYRSYHSGKWHIDGNPMANGFERAFYVAQHDNYFSSKGNWSDDGAGPVPADPSAGYSTIATADHAIECLRKHRAHHAAEPFFQYIAFIAPHFPLHALPEDIAKYRDKYLAGWDVLREARFTRQKAMGLTRTTLSALESEVGPPYPRPQDIAKLAPGEIDRPIAWTNLSAEQQRFQATKMAIHAAMVDRLDREIGRLIAELRVQGVFENTLILFASDNGASAEIMIRGGGHDPAAEPGSGETFLCLGPGFSSAANTPHRRHKTWVHEGGISTPLIAHWPAGISAKNELRDTPGHLIDIVPTVLEVAGLKKPTEWKSEPIPPAPGRSLVPAFSENKILERESLWWLHEGNRAIRVGDWKLVAAAKTDWELYDLRTDRAESQNLAAQMPEKVRELADAWEKQTRQIAELAARSQGSDEAPRSRNRSEGEK